MCIRDRGGEFLKTEVLLVEKDSEELQDEDSGQTPQELEALAIAAEINRITRLSLIHIFRQIFLLE